MHKSILLAALIVGCLFFTSCANSRRGLIYTNVKESGATAEGGGFFGGGIAAVAEYSLEEGKGPGSKKGEVSVSNILGLFAYGDFSVSSAARAGGIKTIHTIDTNVWSILGIYAHWTMHVTGE